MTVSRFLRRQGVFPSYICCEGWYVRGWPFTSQCDDDGDGMRAADGTKSSCVVGQATMRVFKTERRRVYWGSERR